VNDIYIYQDLKLEEKAQIEFCPWIEKKKDLWSVVVASASAQPKPRLQDWDDGGEEKGEQRGKVQSAKCKVQSAKFYSKTLLLCYSLVSLEQIELLQYQVAFNVVWVALVVVNIFSTEGVATSADKILTKLWLFKMMEMA